MGVLHAGQQIEEQADFGKMFKNGELVPFDLVPSDLVPSDTSSPLTSSPLTPRPL